MTRTRGSNDSFGRTRWHYATVLGVALIFGDARNALAVCGDANRDGAVTLVDAVRVLRASAGLQTADPARACRALECDVDGARGIGTSDAVRILREVAGLDSELTCPVLGSASITDMLDVAQNEDGTQWDLDVGIATPGSSAATVSNPNCGSAGSGCNGEQAIAAQPAQFSRTEVAFDTSSSTSAMRLHVKGATAATSLIVRGDFSRPDGFFRFPVPPSGEVNLDLLFKASLREDFGECAVIELSYATTTGTGPSEVVSELTSYFYKIPRANPQAPPCP